MKTFVVTLLVFGIAIIVFIGGGLSWLLEYRRRDDMRRRSAQEAAARFRRRFGSNADRAVGKMLERSNISRRKRRYFNLVLAELQAHPTQRVKQSTSSTKNLARDGSQA